MFDEMYLAIFCFSSLLALESVVHSFSAAQHPAFSFERASESAGGKHDSAGWGNTFRFSPFPFCITHISRTMGDCDER